MSQVKIGRVGRKNCLVMGRTRDERSRIATAVFGSGPGFSMTHRENMPRIAIMRYCPSYMVQRCERSDRSVSTGEKDVLRLAMAEAGDCRLRSFDRSFRRSR